LEQLRANLNQLQSIFNIDLAQQVHRLWVSVEGCQVRQSTLRGGTRETGSSYLRCTEVGT
jgi:hypothetical protein